jgi:hypothetical protein
MGWERLMGRCHNCPAKELKSLPGDELARLVGLYNAKTCRPEYVGGEWGELIAFQVSATQAGRLNRIGNVPLLIVTKDPDENGRKMSAADIAEAAITRTDRATRFIMAGQTCWCLKYEG